MIGSSTDASLTYDALDRLTSVSLGGNTTQFQYDVDKLITKYDRNGNVTHWYAPSLYSDASLVDDEGSSFANVTRYWLMQDENGSVMGMADANANVTPLTYDEYGVPGPTIGGARFQYREGVYDCIQYGLYKR